MKRPAVLASCSCLTSLFLVVLLVTIPAWAAPDKKPSIDTPSSNVGQAKNEDKGLPDRDESKSDKKKGSSVKKSAAKKAGTAAAAGVVTKKVTSEIKK